jgi:hypothetical protein
VDDVLVGAGSLWPPCTKCTKEPNLQNNSAGALCKVTTSEQGVPKTDGLAGLALKLVVGGLGNHVALVNGLKEWIIMGSVDQLDNSMLWNHGFSSPCWRIGQ